MPTTSTPVTPCNTCVCCIKNQYVIYKHSMSQSVDHEIIQVFVEAFK